MLIHDTDVEAWCPTALWLDLQFMLWHPHRSVWIRPPTLAEYRYADRDRRACVVAGFDSGDVFGVPQWVRRLLVWAGDVPYAERINRNDISVCQFVWLMRHPPCAPLN